MLLQYIDMLLRISHIQVTPCILLIPKRLRAPCMLHIFKMLYRMISLPVQLLHTTTFTESTLVRLIPVGVRHVPVTCSNHLYNKETIYERSHTTPSCFPTYKHIPSLLFNGYGLSKMTGFIDRSLQVICGIVSKRLHSRSKNEWR